MTESRQNNSSGVPFLSRIPLLGYLFKSNVRNDQRSELLILIQPNVIETEKDEAVAQALETSRTAIGKDALKILAPPQAPPSKKSGKTPSSAVTTLKPIKETQ